MKIPFSRRTTVCTIEDFLCQRFSTKPEDLRLWHFKDDSHMRLLVDPNAVLEEIGIREDDAILVEVRFFTIFKVNGFREQYIFKRNLSNLIRMNGTRQAHQKCLMIFFLKKFRF